MWQVPFPKPGGIVEAFSKYHRAFSLRLKNNHGVYDSDNGRIGRIHYFFFVFLPFLCDYPANTELSGVNGALTGLRITDGRRCDG